MLVVELVVQQRADRADRLLGDAVEAAGAVEHRHVARADAHERGQVVAVPFAVDVALGDAEAAAEERGVEVRVVDLDAGGQRVLESRLTERSRAAGLDELEPPVLDPVEHA